MARYRSAVEIAITSGSATYAIRAAQILAGYLLECGDCAGGEDLLRGLQADSALIGTTEAHLAALDGS